MDSRYSIAKTVEIGAVLIDRKNIIQSLTETTENIFGYGRGEFVGKGFSLLLSDDDARTHEQTVRNIIEKQSSRKHSRQLVAEMNAVLSNTGCGTLMLDRQLRVRHLNTAFKEIWGDKPYGEDQVAGLRISVISAEDHDRNQFHSLFESWNMAVKVTASATKAPNLMRQGTQTSMPFDFALLEINSDDIDAVAFPRTIHHDPATVGT